MVLPSSLARSGVRARTSLLFACGLALSTLSGGCGGAPARSAATVPAVAPLYPASNSARYELAARASVIVATRRAGEDAEYWYGCSGTLIDKDRRSVLTARHCVHPVVKDKPMLCTFFPVERQGHQLVPAELDAIVATSHSRCTIGREDADLDLAVVHLEDPLPPFARAVELATKDPAVGDAVHGVLAPNLIVNTWFTGYVNNHLSFVNLTMQEGFAPKGLLGFTTPVAVGASGGMVLDEEGHLAGMTVAALHNTSTGIAVPVSAIRERFAKPSP